MKRGSWIWLVFGGGGLAALLAWRPGRGGAKQPRPSPMPEVTWADLDARYNRPAADAYERAAQAAQDAAPGLVADEVMGTGGGDASDAEIEAREAEIQAASDAAGDAAALQVIANNLRKDGRTATWLMTTIQRLQPRDYGNLSLYHFAQLLASYEHQSGSQA